jgi:adenylate cyclase
VDQRVSLADVDRLDGFMFGALGTTPQVRSVGLLTADGKTRRWLRAAKAAIVEDVSERSPARALLERGPSLSGPEWLPPIRSFTNRRAVLVHATPLRVEGRFVGMLVQVVPVVRLSRDMDAIARESNVTPFVLFGKDRVLAHPYMSADEVQSLDNPLPDISSLGDAVLARIYQPDNSSPLGMRTLTNAKASAVTIAGERYVILYRELERFGPEKLTVGAYVNVDRSPEGWPMRRAMQAVLAGVAVLVLAVLFAAIAGRRLSQPIRVLAQAASTAREGKLDEVPKLRRSAIKEFDDAARAFNAMVDGLRERTIIRNTLGRFVSEEVARGLLSGKGELEPVEAKATALVCDLESFTLLTDSLGPRRVVEFLNAYFEAMAQIIERYNGVITQFQGDAVLAVFNVPIHDRDHAAHAVSAAIEMVRAADEHEFAGVRVRNRIGISTGRMLAGAVGSRGRLTYTVHGNTVNVASRIEAMNKDLGTRILVSGKTAERCAGIALRQVAEVEVRGYGERVTLFTPEVHAASEPDRVQSAHV